MYPPNSAVSPPPSRLDHLFKWVSFKKHSRRALNATAATGSLDLFSAFRPVVLHACANQSRFQDPFLQRLTTTFSRSVVSFDLRRE